MNQMLMLTALLLMSACALGPKSTLGPDGKPVTFIDGMSAAVTYDKARKACPNGYAIVEEPQEKAFIDYEMKVECK
ncbi:MAG TPA: hypothetical protein VK820_03055 [Steroidobacteraceae bacterium]|nr:hypothetical protein [Steroidobacteraceae bacterium]